jgi:3-oxoacyl-[acyl-carrier-protein] synthase II
MTALSSTDVSMPFDKNRDGFVIAEGAATLILEDLEHAKRRGANILGLIIGAASSADAHHITAPAPNGLGALSCMQLALEDANLEPEEISHINAHGTSTPLNDAAEAEAIGKLFSSNRPPVTSIKGAIGHSLCAAGAIEAVACILTNQKELIPPTIGLKILDPEFNMDVVKDEPRKFQPGNIISNSFGFGGHNGSVIIAPPH